jgi:hypothetical protein
VSSITFDQNGHIQENGRGSVACVRESLIFEARGSSTLLSSGSIVNFEMEYRLSLRVLKCEEHHYGAKLPF